MKSRILIFVALVFSISFCVDFGGISREEYCEKAWRYELECALNKTLSLEELEKISSLSNSLRGSNCVETAWNTLEWVQGNIRYDDVKASLPLPLITVKGRNVTVQSPGRFYQTPEETVKLRKGICGDIAILTTALMLSNNCSSYIAFVDFRDEEVDHLASLVFLDKFYVLDQNLPPLDLGSYYNKWLREGKKIERILIYDKGLKVGNLSAEDLQSQNQGFSERELSHLKSLVTNEIKKKFTFGNVERFKEKLVVKIKFEGLVEYYSDTFAEKIAKMIAEKSLEKVEGKWDRFTIELNANFPDLETTLTFFRV